MKHLRYLLLAVILLPMSVAVSSCSDNSESEEEYANWQQTNEAKVTEWAANGSLMKIKSYTKDPATEGKNLDYIYVEVLEEGKDDQTPLFTDTVRVAYRGRLLPSKSYADGFPFDENFKGSFAWNRADVTDFTPASLVDGFATAVMSMRKGDYWRVHIPYSLGYGTAGSSNIPAYSDLVFEIAMFDFWSPGEDKPDFKTR